MSKKFFGFSVLELIIMLVAVSVITVSMSPAITKKIKSNKTIMNASQVTRNCMPNCSLCKKTPRGDECMICNAVCPKGKTVQKRTCECVECSVFDANCIACNEKGCTLCKPGFIIGPDGKCKPCSKTSADPEKVSAECHICNGVEETVCPTLGTIPSADRISCVQCEDGTIASCDNCEVCPDGTYANSTHSECLPCPKGHYCVGGKKYETEAGSYQDQEGQSSAKICPDGQYQPNKAQTSCICCSEGTFAKTKATSTTYLEKARDHKECNACPQSPLPTYASNSCASQCTRHTVTNCCEYNTLRNECVSCKAGYGLYHGECIPCSGGTYAEECGKYACRPSSVPNCAIVNPETGACEQCNPCYELKNNQCTKCPTGYYSDDGLTCKKHTAQNCQVASCSMNGCVACMAGFEPKNGGCQPCPSGKWSQGGQNQCINGECEKVDPTNGKCLDCDAGYELRNGICVPCQDGYYAEKGDNVCKLNTQKGCKEKSKVANLCLSCLPEYGFHHDGICTHAKNAGYKQFPRTVGYAQMAYCPGGTEPCYAIYDNYSNCRSLEYDYARGGCKTSNCKPGLYFKKMPNDIDNSSVREFALCHHCALNYESVDGRTCRKCEVGKWSNGAKCCEAGYEQLDTAENICTPCPKGRKCPPEGQSVVP